MKKIQKSKTLISIAIALGIACAVFGVYRWSAYRWDQSFVGRPLSELEGALAERGKSLWSVAPDSFQTHTGQTVKPDQEVWSFTKGEWSLPFIPMTVGEMRFVLVKKDGERRIVAVIRYRSVDSL